MSLCVLERPASPVFRLRWKHFIALATGSTPQRCSVERSVPPFDGELGNSAKHLLEAPSRLNRSFVGDDWTVQHCLLSQSLWYVPLPAFKVAVNENGRKNPLNEILQLRRKRQRLWRNGTPICSHIQDV